MQLFMYKNPFCVENKQIYCTNKALSLINLCYFIILCFYEIPPFFRFYRLFVRNTACFVYFFLKVLIVIIFLSINS